MFVVSTLCRNQEIHEYVCESRNAVSTLTWIYENSDHVLQYKVLLVNTGTQLSNAKDLGIGFSSKWVEKFTY